MDQKELPNQLNSEIEFLQSILNLNWIKSHRCFQNTGKIVLVKNEMDQNVYLGVIRNMLPYNKAIVDMVLKFRKNNQTNYVAYRSTYQVDWKQLIFNQVLKVFLISSSNISQDSRINLKKLSGIGEAMETHVWKQDMKHETEWEKYVD